MQSACWQTSPLSYETVRNLSRQAGLSEITAAVLARRGYDTPDAVREFLDPQGRLHDPFLFPSMQDACNRIRQAIEGGEKICIHGDYDVDGITATVLLVGIIGELGGRVCHRLPNRFHGGYGVSAETVKEIAGEGVSLLVTVDCGIGAREELDQAAGLGLDVIVVDHHRPSPEHLPEALIVSPLLCEYPFKELAGVGLAFKLAQGLLAEYGRAGDGEELDPLLQERLDLVALGTIADVVPLLDENRSLVKRGLTRLSRTRNPGLKALMRVGRVEPSRLNAGLVAFRMAPRINAAGRLGDPELALRLLLSQSEAEADPLAEELDGLNRERQRIENKILAEAQETIGSWPDETREARGYVLSNPGWHEGVIGIVASRLVELHHRPVIMIAAGEETGKGSGRSIPGFDLHAALTRLGDMLETFGGHRAACGLTIPLENVDGFREGFAGIAGEALGEEDLHPKRFVDAVVSGRELTLELAEELSRLEPFGLGNPSVELVAPGSRISGGRKTRDGRHLQCRIDAGGGAAGAIGFEKAYLLDSLDDSCRWDVVFRLERNEFNGTVSPQLNLRELFRHEEAPPPPGFCESRCNQDCPDRAGARELRRFMVEEDPLPQAWLGGKTGVPAHPLPGGEGAGDRIVDRRGFGAIPQQLVRLVSSGESLLLVVADVSRRRRLITHELPLGGETVVTSLLASGRCSDETLRGRIEAIGKEETPLLVMADFSTLAAEPGMARSFPHLVFIDPPFSHEVFAAIAAAAPGSLLHLMYCEDELQFTERVLRHEFSLRAPLAKVYRQLRACGPHPLDETLATLLLAGGKHLRQPAMVGRCLRILVELELVTVEENGEVPILSTPDRNKTELERSPTFNTIESFYQECQKHLKKLRNTKTN